jgi:hypothetical protein
MLGLFQVVHVIVGEVSKLVSHPLSVMLMLIKVGIVGVYVMFKWGYSAICSFKKLHSLQGRKRTICLLSVCRCSMGGAETLVAVAGMVSYKAQGGDFNSQSV